MGELISTAPRAPGVPINTDVGVVGWAQELHKTPPKWAWTDPDYVPEVSREGGWRRMVWSDVLGWAYQTPMDILHPTTWSAHVPSVEASLIPDGNATTAATTDASKPEKQSTPRLRARKPTHWSEPMSANDYGWLMITALYFPPKRNREHNLKKAQS